MLTLLKKRTRWIEERERKIETETERVAETTTMRQRERESNGNVGKSSLFPELGSEMWMLPNKVRHKREALLRLACRWSRSISGTETVFYLSSLADRGCMKDIGNEALRRQIFVYIYFSWANNVGLPFHQYFWVPCILWGNKSIFMFFRSSSFCILCAVPSWAQTRFIPVCVSVSNTLKFLSNLEKFQRPQQFAWLSVAGGMFSPRSHVLRLNDKPPLM